MIFQSEITVHAFDQHPRDITSDIWDKHFSQDIEARYCSYCGSLHPEDMYNLLDKADRVEFADMKYGYPHKLYIDIGATILKFYTKHLTDINDKETLDLILNKIKEKTGVKFKSHLDKKEN